MGVNDILCTYASPCTVSLHVPSRYGLWVEQTVIKIPSKLYNKRIRDHLPVGKGGGGLDNSDVSVNASYINNDGFKLFMCGDHFQDNLNLCTEGMGVAQGLLSYMLSSSLYHGYLECA